MKGQQFGVFSVVFWVFFEADQKGIRSPARRVFVFPDVAR